MSALLHGLARLGLGRLHLEGATRMAIRPGWDRVRLRCEHLEARETPAATVWTQQSFDDLVFGSIPSNWQQWSSPGVASFGAGTQHTYSGDQGLTTTALSNQTARAWSSEVMPADFATSAYVYLDSLQPIQFIVRGQNLAGNSPSYYALSINRGLQADLSKGVGGTA